MDALAGPLQGISDNVYQLKIILILLVVFVGIGVAFVNVFMVTYFLLKFRHEKATMITALRSEIELNLDVTDEILKANAGVDFGADDSELCEAIPMSETLWTAGISGGQLSHLDRRLIGSLSRSYAKIRRANTLATKIRYGKFHPRDGKDYNAQIETIQSELAESLKWLNRYASQNELAESLKRLNRYAK